MKIEVQPLGDLIKSVRAYQHHNSILVVIETDKPYCLSCRGIYEDQPIKFDVWWEHINGPCEIKLHGLPINVNSHCHLVEKNRIRLFLQELTFMDPGFEVLGDQIASYERPVVVE